MDEKIRCPRCGAVIGVREGQVDVDEQVAAAIAKHSCKIDSHNDDLG